MPHSISAKKRVRQIKRRSERNRTIKSRLRTNRRAFLKAVEAQDLPGAREHLKACERLLHRAANNGPIHRNTAGRIVSRMQHRVAALEKAAAK
jgi:small subunit ribosomal protein S20